MSAETILVQHARTNVEAILVQHLGEHAAQPCYIVFEDGTPSACDIQMLCAEVDRLRSDIDVERLARALPLELHIDERHGFPPGYTASDLAVAIAIAYREVAK